MPRWTVSPTTHTTLSSHRSFRIVLSLFSMFLRSSVPRRYVPALLSSPLLFFSSLAHREQIRYPTLEAGILDVFSSSSSSSSSLIKLDSSKTNKPNTLKKRTNETSLFLFSFVTVLLHYRGSTRPRAPVYATDRPDKNRNAFKRVKRERRLTVKVREGRTVFALSSNDGHDPSVGRRLTTASRNEERFSSGEVGRRGTRRSA